jgi:hypothetical protein
MFKRRVAAAGVLLCSLVTLTYAADVLSLLGITPQAAKQAVNSVLNSGVYNPGLPAGAFKLMPAAARAEAVAAGVAWLKAYTASAEFKQEYAQIRENQKPPAPEFAGTPEEEIKKADEENVKNGRPPRTEAEKAQMKNGPDKLIAAVNSVAPGFGDANRAAILQNAYLFRVSPFWLILAYAIVTLGELMLSPMGLSLVSKVAPIGIRGLMMGGWFVATAIGNKLTQIGVFWDIWLQSTFFLVLACMALFMAIVLAVLLKPLKKAMPGV